MRAEVNGRRVGSALLSLTLALCWLAQAGAQGQAGDGLGDLGLGNLGLGGDLGNLGGSGGGGGGSGE